MANPDVGNWPIEVIPNDDRLFLRVHIALLPSKVLHPGIFREQGEGMSTDWEKYSTAEEARRRARDPSKNGIVALVAGVVRSIDDLEVRHAPDYARRNRAHSLVLGIDSPGPLPPAAKKTMVRALLFESFRTWEIDPFELPEASNTT
jgi:hypothetical protein